MRKILLILLYLALFSKSVMACESCSVVRSRSGSDTLYRSGRWFFDFTQEGVNWNTRPAREAHQLHHEDHHVHNKTHEEFYHFSFGANPDEASTLLMELPYVVRSSTEIDSHATLGKQETAEGLGDMKLTGIYRFWRDHGNFLGALGGVKLPTGSTDELNSVGTLFEPELQPGSGSTDASTGGVFQFVLGEFTLHGNVVYTFRTEGAHDFEGGDLFSSFLSLDRVLNPAAKDGRVTLGADLNFQSEGEPIEDGHENPDSGGDTLLLGPSLKIRANDRLALLANILLPVHQNLGGVHQEVDFIWNASAKISW